MENDTRYINLHGKIKLISIALVNLNKNPKTKIPFFFIEKLKNKFKEFDFRIIEEPHQLKSELQDVSYILGWSFPKVFIKKNTKLKEVLLFSSQTPESFKKQSFVLHSITGINAPFVVEYILSALEKINKKNILIIGKGTIGKLLLDNLKGQGAKCVTRLPQGDHEIGYEQYQDAIKNSDIIIPTVSLNRETIELFKKNVFFDHLKSDVFLLNTARGELFKEEDLLKFFKENPNSFYHTDVTVPEPYPKEGQLRDLKNVKITNHIAGFGTGIWDLIYKRTETIVSRWT
ncbi:MAG: hypothetical protein CME70_23145 [Halobacteriovorax sp.]|nr:hypothetical protein [Halobacteriovorax sp.]